MTHVQHTDDDTDQDRLYTHPLVYVTIGWLLAGIVVFLFTWPTATNPAGSAALSLLLLAVAWLAATLCGIGAAVLLEMRRHR